MWSIAETILYALLFMGVYKLTDTKQTNNMSTEDMDRDRNRGQQLKQKLHKYREQGVNMANLQEMYLELVRRGINPADIPKIDAFTSLQEFAANIELQLQETPFKPRDLNEPGEDRTLAKSTFQTWARPLEPQNGDN